MASDTDALQLFNGLTNVIESHVVRDTRSADAWCHNEPHFSAFEFFIELYSVENLLARKLRWQPRRQSESSKKINNCVALIRRQPSPFHRNCASDNDSKAHRFSMKKFPVISGALDRVTDRVAEIQKCALASRVTFVSADNSRFDLNVALDKSLQRGRVPDLPRLQRPKHFLHP